MQVHFEKERVSTLQQQRKAQEVSAVNRFAKFTLVAKRKPHGRRKSS